MKIDFLKLKPTRYLCPYCGEWHKWPYGYNLEHFKLDGAVLYCANEMKAELRTQICFKDGYCYYKTVSIGNVSNIKLDGKILIDDIDENDENYTVTFNVLKVKFGFEFLKTKYIELQYVK